jgi:hypothetical protein
MPFSLNPSRLRHETLCDGPLSICSNYSPEVKIAFNLYVNSKILNNIFSETIKAKAEIFGLKIMHFRLFILFDFPCHAFL